MHPEQIKAEIRMAGTTPSVIAAEMGLSRTTISQIIHGAGRSARVEKRISDLLQKPIEEIWPHRPKRLPTVPEIKRSAQRKLTA